MVIHSSPFALFKNILIFVCTFFNRTSNDRIIASSERGSEA